VFRLINHLSKRGGVVNFPAAPKQVGGGSPTKKSRYRLVQGQTIDRILVKLDYLIIYFQQGSWKIKGLGRLHPGEHRQYRIM
jgi:hypothetical protein